MRRIVVLNPKGGSGKTTIATNLAAWYAVDGTEVALIDRDHQGSAKRWLNKRRADLPGIHGISYFDKPAGVTHTFATRIPQHAERVVTDTAAALSRPDLLEITRTADKIIVPVLPSDIDIHAAAGFISQLLLQAKVSRRDSRLGVVANRVKRNTLMFGSLMRFLGTLGIPVIAVLRDAQVYVRAAESGRGLADLRKSDAGPDLAQWRALAGWVEQDHVPDADALFERAAEAAPQPRDAVDS